jgi:predicted nucleic acid-binding protein
VIVADTNIVVYFLIRGAFTAEAERVRARDVRWLVPALYRSEFLNVLSSHVRFRGMDRDAALKLFHRGMSMVRVDEEDPDPLEVVKISQSGDCSSYDAEFVWLARERGVTLVTTDDEVLKAFPDVAVHPARFP